MVLKRLVFKWSRFEMGSEIRKPFGIQTTGCHFVKKTFEIKTKLYCPVLKVGTKAITKSIAPLFENWTIQILTVLALNNWYSFTAVVFRFRNLFCLFLELFIVSGIHRVLLYSK